MDVVFCFNGLGNQMSQYAFALKKKSINSSTRIIFDKRSRSEHNGFELDKIFNIPYSNSFVNFFLYWLFRIRITEKMRLLSKPLISFLSLIGVRIYFEPFNYDYTEEFVRPKGGINFYWGGWHSEKYFCSVKELILAAYEFKIDSDDLHLLNLVNQIKSTNSVSIHIRRGDFLGNAAGLHGGICTKEYFLAAIAKMQSVVNHPHFYLFSDNISNDLVWIKECLNYDNYTIVDSNKGENAWKDMFLISNCKHHINSNSTFSWWGAWLNINDDKVVIVPKAFMKNVVTKDVYPEDWIQLENN